MIVLIVSRGTVSSVGWFRLPMSSVSAGCVYLMSLPLPRRLERRIDHERLADAILERCIFDDLARRLRRLGLFRAFFRGGGDGACRDAGRRDRDERDRKHAKR